MGWGVHDYPSPPPQKNPICPVCGWDCGKVYFQNGQVIGCDNCITEQDAYEWEEERNEE